MSRFKVGLIGTVVLVVFTYLGFTKFSNPFASQFTLHAIVSSVNGLSPNSLVRIAGVNVGKVTSVQSVSNCGAQNRDCQAAEISMAIDDNGLPIHSDATLTIRPRIFLEGNFFVDVNPGTPSAPTVGSGHMFPIQQTREPVQLDQILGSLQSDTRHNLQILLDQYGSAVKRAGPAFNASVKYWLPAYEYSGIVSHDFLGILPHDLSNAIYAQGDVSAAFDAHPQNLQSLISDFNTTANAFARQSANLQRAVAELPGALAAATPAFDALNAAFPPVRALARALLPGVKSSGPTIDVSLPFINQLRLLVQPAELRGLSHDLAGTVPSLAKLTQVTIPLMANGVRPVSSCTNKVILPWSTLQIHDPNFNAANGFPVVPAYVETLQLLPGIAGETSVSDANGPYIRLEFGGGTTTYSLQPGLFGTTLAPLTGVQPQSPAGVPPLMESVPCETQAPIASLDTPVGAPPPQVQASLSAPGALLRFQSSAKALADMVNRTAQQTGSPQRMSSQWDTAAQIASVHR